eukprot:TRINITY_DN4917_c0_g1_i2.p1 TRINITY_DN4917_c0_g1~~TRINITY_DN4917_c0_g1_i2.p1  ORF type:complete len:899 (-),score=178.45 TRINITY_DN4917_c0_g1_i2:9-2705(-)
MRAAQKLFCLILLISIINTETKQLQLHNGKTIDLKSNNFHQSNKRGIQDGRYQFIVYAEQQEGIEYLKKFPKILENEQSWYSRVVGQVKRAVGVSDTVDSVHDLFDDVSLHYYLDKDVVVVSGKEEDILMAFGEGFSVVPVDASHKMSSEFFLKDKDIHEMLEGLNECNHAQMNYLEVDVLFIEGFDQSEENESILKVMKELSSNGFQLSFTGIGTGHHGMIYIKHEGINLGQAEEIANKLYSLGEKLSAQESVHCISMRYPAVTMNKNAKWVSQSGIKDYSPLNLTGSKQLIAVADTGIDASNCFFYDPDHGFSSSNGRFGGIIDQKHRKILGEYKFIGSEVGVDFHGTHIAATIAGKRLSQNELSHYNGIAEDSRLLIIDIGCSDDTCSPTGKCPRPLGEGELCLPNYHDIFKYAYDNGAHIYLNSWGSGKSYTAESSLIDEFIYNHPDFLVVFPSGNSGWGVTRQAASKNGITVGSIRNSIYSFDEALKNSRVSDYDTEMIEHVREYLSTYIDSERNWEYIQDESTCCYCAYREKNKLVKDVCRECCTEAYGRVIRNNPGILNYTNLATYSGYGIIDEPGRYKPDLVAPGDKIISASKTSTSEGDSCINEDLDNNQEKQLLALSGTSNAAAVVTGCAALVRQYFMEGYYPYGTKNTQKAFVPSATLIKAILISSAEELTGTDPIDFESLSYWKRRVYYGFGRVTLSNILSLSDVSETTIIPRGDKNSDLKISNGEEQSYCITPKENGVLKVTVAWPDLPASPLSVTQVLINNIDFKVFDGNKLYYGNDRDGIMVSDTVNNVEKIIAEAETGKPLLLRIYGEDIKDDNQPFAVVLSGIRMSVTKGVGQCAPIPLDDYNEHFLTTAIVVSIILGVLFIIGVVFMLVVRSKKKKITLV